MGCDGWWSSARLVEHEHEVDVTVLVENHVEGRRVGDLHGMHENHP